MQANPSYIFVVPYEGCMIYHRFWNQRWNLNDGGIDEGAAIGEIISRFQSSIDVAESSSHCRISQFLLPINEGIAIVPKHACFPLVWCAAYGLTGTSDAFHQCSE